MLGDGGTYEMTLPDGTKVVLAPGERLIACDLDGTVLGIIADNTPPSGLCPRCHRPLDDHTWDKAGPLCPKVTA